MPINSGRSVEDRVYMEGTCKFKATIMWALLDTGLTLSLYMVKLSSLHRISGLFELAGEFDVEGEDGQLI